MTQVRIVLDSPESHAVQVVRQQLQQCPGYYNIYYWGKLRCGNGHCAAVTSTRYLGLWWQSWSGVIKQSMSPRQQYQHASAPKIQSSLLWCSWHPHIGYVMRSFLGLVAARWSSSAGWPERHIITEMSQSLGPVTRYYIDTFAVYLAREIKQPLLHPPRPPPTYLCNSFLHFIHT